MPAPKVLLETGVGIDLGDYKYVSTTEFWKPILPENLFRDVDFDDREDLIQEECATLIKSLDKIEIPDEPASIPKLEVELLKHFNAGHGDHFIDPVASQLAEGGKEKIIAGLAASPAVQRVFERRAALSAVEGRATAVNDAAKTALKGVVIRALGL